MNRRALLKRTATATTALGLAGSAAAARRRRRGSEDGPTLESFEVRWPREADADSELTDATVDGSTITITGLIAPDGRGLDGATPSVSRSDGAVRLTVPYESRETRDGNRRRRTRIAPGYAYEAVVSVGSEPDAVEAVHVDETLGVTPFRGRKALGSGPDWDFLISGRDADAENSADISMNGSNVTVDGVVVGADACTTAVPSATVVDDGVGFTERGIAEIDVETRRSADENEVCAQTVIGIDYRLEVAFDGDPYEVAVSHDGESVAVYPEVYALD